MLDFGLVGGRATGGLGALASTATGKAPAGTAAAADADAGALGGAFRDLVDALSDGKHAPAEAAHTRTQVETSNSPDAAGNTADAAGNTGVVELTAALPVAVPPFRPEEGPHTALDQQAGAGGVKEKTEASTDAVDASARVGETAPTVCPFPQATPKPAAPDQPNLAEIKTLGTPASAPGVDASAAAEPGEARAKHAGGSKRVNTDETDVATDTPQVGITLKRPAIAFGEHAGKDAGADANPSEQRPENLVRAATTRQIDGATTFVPTPAPVVTGPVVVVPAMTTPIVQAPSLRAVASDSPRSSASPESTAPQIVQAIRLAWSRGVGEAHIRLDPEQFGDVSVSLRVERGQVVARLQADAPAVREWLQANQHTLKSGLAEHELKLGRLDVVSPDELRDQSRRDAREQGTGADDRPFRRFRRPDTGSRFEIVA